MDLATILGLIMGFALVCWAIVAGGSARGFWDPASIAIVLGGGICATLVGFPLTGFKRIFSIIKKALTHRPRSAEKLIADMVSYAEIARRDGILSLENMTKDIDDPFIVRGIQMAVDGTDPELIEQIMTTELENLVERHEFGRNIFESLGRYLPAFGMIGTLIGLVTMLQNMDDPSKIGGGMAIALLTTLYGAIMANLAALPIADKLAKRSAEEVLHKTIIVKGVMSIQSGDNPRIVQQKLMTFLPPNARPSETGEDERAAAA